LTALSRDALRTRRFHRKMTALGYEEVGENGGRLWEIRRGWRVGSRIVDAVVAPHGLSIYVRIEPTSSP
jgi:hypothetical protein